MKKWLNTIQKEKTVMNEYEEYIQSLSTEDRKQVFYNTGPRYAGLVLGIIFSKANEYVKIYAGCFSGDISKQSQYIEGLDKYLKKGKPLQILLQEQKIKQYIESNGEPSIFKLLRYYSIINPGQITIKTHKKRLIDSTTGREIHFTVADDKMYRIEDDIVNFSFSGNFNDPEKAKELSTKFDNIFIAKETSENSPLITNQNKEVNP